MLDGGTTKPFIFHNIEWTIFEFCVLVIVSYFKAMYDFIADNMDIGIHTKLHHLPPDTKRNMLGDLHMHYNIIRNFVSCAYLIRPETLYFHLVNGVPRDCANWKCMNYLIIIQRIFALFLLVE